MSWVDVSAPSWWTWTLPFTIQREAGTRNFRVDPDFNIQTYAGITVTTTYYVDKSSGLDTNTGLSWDQAFQTLTKAWGMADVDRVYVRDSYFYKAEASPLPTRNVETIATDASVYISADFYNELGSFSLVDNHYEGITTSGLYRSLGAMVDLTNLDAFGFPTALIKKTSIAEVDAAVNSFWMDYTGAPDNPIYIHTFDNRAPDANLRYLDGYATNYTKDSYILYFEGINFVYNLQVRNLSATGGLKAYFKDCNMGAILVGGVDEILFFDCIGHNSAEDGFNYDARNGVVTKAAEYNCEIYNGGGATSDQCSTGHNGCKIVRIMGKYYQWAGQCIADVNATTQSWLLGCETYNSTSGIGYYSGGTMELDRCESHDNATYDLQNTVNTTIYTTNFEGELGINDISGALVATDVIEESGTMSGLRWLELDSNTNINVSSATLVGSYTSDADRLLTVTLYAQGLAGGGDYVYYITVTPSGLSEGEALKTTQTLGATTYVLFGVTVGIPVRNGDVVKVYLDGLAGDTTTPDTRVNFYEDASLELSTTALETITALSGDTLTIWRGDTLSATFTDLPSNTGYVTIDLTVKEAKTDSDDDCILRIRKNASGTGDGLMRLNKAALVVPVVAADGSITVNSSTSLTIALAARATDDLVPSRSLRYDIQYIMASSVTTATEAACIIEGDVTRLIT